MLIKCVAFIAVSAVVLTCRGADRHVLAGTLSPDRHTAIVEESDDRGDRNYYFAAQPGNRKLGDLYPPSEDLSNVAVVASWNANSSKVAILLFYGTKLSGLLLFSKDGSGRFQELTLKEPDPEAVYRQRTGHTIPRPGDGYDENGLGPWIDKDTVRMVSGEAIRSEDPDHHTHVLITFKVRVQGKDTVISDLELLGPFSDEAAKKFIKRWGTRYFEPDDE